MTMSGRLLRLRRTAHRPPGGDPAGPPVLGFASPDRPPLGTLSPTACGSGSPFGSSMGKGFFQKSFSSSPAGAKWSGRGWRFACKSPPEPATAQRAECLLRSTTRGPARSKAIRARHGEAVASGHSFSGTASVFSPGVGHTGVQMAFLAIGGYGTIPPAPCVRCRANLGPWRGCFWGLVLIRQGGGR